MTLSIDTADTKDGILVYPAQDCVGYHLLSAFLRLAKNCKGLVLQKNQAAPVPACPVIEHNFYAPRPGNWLLKAEDLGAAVLILENEVQNNTPPSTQSLDELLAFAQTLLSVHGDLHLVFVFPRNFPEAAIAQFLKLGKKITVFVSPPTFAFGDHSLMDLSLKHRSTPLPMLKKLRQPELSVGLVSAPDLVGFLISALQNSVAYGKVFWVPEQLKDLNVWVDVFKKYFDEQEISFIDHFLSNFRTSPFNKVAFNKTSAAASVSAVDPREFFPNPLQSLDRYMKSSFENFTRTPQRPEHFPARRAL